MPPAGEMNMLGTSPCDVSTGSEALIQATKKLPPQQTEEEKKATAWGRDKCHGEYKSNNHVILTTHPRRGCPIKIQWGAKDPAARGPVIASVIQPRLKNAIGTHNGSYSVYRSIAVAAGSVLVAGCCCTCLLVALPFMLVSQGSGMTLTLVSPFLATCAVLNKLIAAGKWIPCSGLIFTTPRLLSRSVQRLRGSTQPRSSRWIRGAT